MNIKRIVFAVIALTFILAFTGCSEKENRPQEDLKIISTAADITEILDGLGLGKNIAAADMYSAGVGSVDPSVCTLDYMNPDVEAILALSPDVVFVSGSSTDGTVDPYSALKDFDMNVVYIPTAGSIEDIKDNINIIASNVSAEDKAKELTDSIDMAVESAKEKAEGLSKVSVYFEIGAAPWLYTTGGGTFINEIITLCGGENIYGGENGWLSNTEESVLAANPAVIISNVRYDGYDFNEIYSRPGWDVIDAVKNSRVVNIDPDSSSRGSQNIVKAIDEIARAIHPEAYEN